MKRSKRKEKPITNPIDGQGNIIFLCGTCCYFQKRVEESGQRSICLNGLKIEDGYQPACDKWLF